MSTVSGRNGRARAIRRVVVQPPGAPARVLLENASYGRLVGNSVLVYQRGNSLYATRLELGTLTTSGWRDALQRSVAFDPAAVGRWRRCPRVSSTQFEFSVRLGRPSGREASLPSPLRPYRAPSLSPRADRIAVQVAEEDRSDVWMLDVEQQRLTPLTNDGNSEYPMWTPDGGRVGFARRRDDTSDFFVMTPQGTEPRLIKRGDMRMWIGSWMPDMRGIVYMQEDTRTQSDLWLADLQTQAQPRSVVRTAAREYGGRVSPDGRWIAYFSDEHSPNQFELYVAAMPKGAPRHRVAPVGAREAVWARDGGELFYRNGRQMMSARIPRGSDFPEIRPIPLFEGEYLAFGGPGIVNYDVSPDGGRFLMLKPVEDGAHLTVVQGLTRLIRDRLARSKIAQLYELAPTIMTGHLLLACVAALTISAAASAFAQSTTGAIRGTIRDNLDAAVPGVAVTIRNVDTNVARTVITDDEGYYRALNLPVGHYALSRRTSRVREVCPVGRDAGRRPGRSGRYRYQSGGGDRID